MTPTTSAPGRLALLSALSISAAAYAYFVSNRRTVGRSTTTPARTTPKTSTCVE